MIKSRLSETNLVRWQKFTPVLWIIAGVLFLLPGLLGSTNTTSVGIGLMFIIFGIVFAKKNKKNLSDPKAH